jgi:uncharacterized membrane protein YhaH (DUF805 family)
MSQVQDDSGGFQFRGTFEENAAQEQVASSFDALPPFPKLFSFSGRMGRAAFGVNHLFFVVTLVAGVLTLEGFFAHGLQEIITIGTPLLRAYTDRDLVSTFDQIGGEEPLRFGMLLLIIPAWYLVALSANVRRLHDLDYSGWTLVGLGIAGAIPVIGVIVSLLSLGLFFAPGSDGHNTYGPPPKSAHVMARVRQLPRHVWRGETSLLNMLLVYVFFFNFILLDKIGATLMAKLELTTVNLLFIAALIILNCILVISVWRCAAISTSSMLGRLVGQFVAVFLVTRVVITLAGFAMATRA